MARWNIHLPSYFMDELSKKCTENANAICEGKVPVYPQFVTNLLKDGATPSEEFLHAAVGLAGEAAGEVLEIAKKVHFYGKELDADKLVQELGDMRFYYQAILNEFHLTDAQIIAANMTKLRKRYSSGKFSSEQALARADEQQPARKFMSDAIPVPADGLYQDLPLSEKVRQAQVRAAEATVAAELERKLGKTTSDSIVQQRVGLHVDMPTNLGAKCAEEDRLAPHGVTLEGSNGKHDPLAHAQMAHAAVNDPDTVGESHE